MSYRFVLCLAVLGAAGCKSAAGGTDAGGADAGGGPDGATTETLGRCTAATCWLAELELKVGLIEALAHDPKTRSTFAVGRFAEWVRAGGLELQGTPTSDLLLARLVAGKVESTGQAGRPPHGYGPRDRGQQ